MYRRLHKAAGADSSYRGGRDPCYTSGGHLYILRCGILRQKKERRSLRNAQQWLLIYYISICHWCYGCLCVLCVCVCVYLYCCNFTYVSDFLLIFIFLSVSLIFTFVKLVFR